MATFTESEIEIFSLEELKRLEYSYIWGPSIAPDGEYGATLILDPAPTGRSENHQIEVEI